MVAYSEYPYDARIRNEAEILAAAGYEVHVIAARPKEGQSSRLIGGVYLHEVPLSIQRGSRWRYLFQYATFLVLSGALLAFLSLKRRIQLVHVHTLPDFLVFCTVPLRFAGATVILDLHESMPELYTARFPTSVRSTSFHLLAILERVSCAFADYLIVAGHGIQDALISRGVPRDRVTVIYNWVDPRGIPVSPSALQARLGLPPGRLIVHAGSVNKERDLATLVESVKLLRKDLDVRLVIAGVAEPAYLKQLGSLAASLDISGYVHFVGNLTIGEARALMSLSEFGVVALERNPHSELAWPMRIVELSSLGKPLVISRLRFMSEVLGNTAWYYEPGDAHSLAEAIRDLLDHPKRAEASVVAANRILEQFSFGRMSNALLDLYAKARTEGHPKSGGKARQGLKLASTDGPHTEPEQ
jgi:glycosyltransferase involved in cell wall biosynthesis